MNDSDEPTQALPNDDWAAEPADEASAAPGVDESASATSGRPRPLVWLLSALLVAALVGGIAWFAVISSRQNRENAMREAAGGWLTAIAEGDSATAVDLLAEPPTNTALLTDEVMAASRDAAPLTGIEVGPIGDNGTPSTVEVTYQLGGRDVVTTLELTSVGGAWKIADGTVDLTVPERRAVTVNGAIVTEEVNPVFPGSYTAAAAIDKVAVTGEPTVSVTAPDQESALFAVTVGLSEVGTQTVLNTVKGRFDECLASTESRPVNCPFGVGTEDVEVAEGSVRFAPVNDPWAGFAPTLDPATMVASGTIPYQVNATATVSKDGLTTEATALLSGDRGYAVDLTQDPAVVTWS